MPVFLSSLSHTIAHTHAHTLKPHHAPQIFNALNTLELKSLEEIRYLLNEFAKHPLECLTLALYTTVNVGEYVNWYELYCTLQ